jgi:hAT family C-terminal dimerisation region
VIRNLQLKKNQIAGIPEPDDEEMDTVEKVLTSASSEDPLENLLATLRNGQETEQDVTVTRTKKRSDLENEILKYEKKPGTDSKSNALVWWHEHKKDFPILGPLACDILAAPVTEVSVERLFSHLKLIVTKNRSTLKGSLLNDIMFLRMNRTFTNSQVSV